MTVAPRIAFYVTLHAAPTQPGPLTATSVSQQGFAGSFADVATALEKLPRLYFEPDGAILWTGTAHNQPWQVDGTLYDRGDCLAYAELKGSCPLPEWEALLRCFGWPECALVVQEVQSGAFLSETDFRRQALTAT